MIRISDLTVIHGRAPKSVLNRALEWAKEHQADLALAWITLNEH